MDVRIVLLPFIVIPAILLALGWHREIKNRHGIQWSETLWIPLALETLSLLWLLRGLRFDPTFSMDPGVGLCLNVPFAIIAGGLAARAKNSNKYLVTWTAAWIAIEWIGAVIMEASV